MTIPVATPADSVDIVVSWHLCLDMHPDLAGLTPDQLAASGRLFGIGPLEVSTGGVVGNTGLALHRLGVKVGLMSALGDDLAGKATLAYIEQFGVGLSEGITVRPGASSPYTLVMEPRGADRSFLSFTGPHATFDSSSIDYAKLADVKLFHFGYPPLLPRTLENDGAELATMFRKAREAGAVTSLDMVLPHPDTAAGQADWRAIFKNTLPFVDIFLPSLEETVFTLRRSDYDAWAGHIQPHLTADYVRDLADDLLSMGVAVAGNKLGEYGIYLRTTADPTRLSRLQVLTLDLRSSSDVERWHPAFEVKVTGTSGAGDAAYAGFLAALLKGFSPPQALRWACAVGACNVEVADSVSGVRTWENTEQRLAGNWPVRRERLTGYEKDESDVKED